MKDVIAAIATPPGRGAIGVVRMSGGGAQEILGRVWKSNAHPVDKFVTHRVYLGKIADFSTGKVIDNVLATLMKGPNSYTGEDLIEISCHGGPLVIRAVLDQLIGGGARPAGPGEFTKRAFLNGKMDLVQAEAVAALIGSKSSLASKIAGEHLDGRLSNLILDLRERLKKLLAFTEASIDFPEEDIELIKGSDVRMRLESILSDIKRLVSSYDQGRVIREGVKTVIAGPPNAGKSSLFNALLGIDRAIVHHAPGTTRDTIEEEMVFDGISFRLIDTAGIREAEVEVEEIGVRRSREAAGSAEVVLLVVDGHDFREVDKRFVEELRGVVHVVVVVNKKDLGLRIGGGELKRLFGDRPFFEVSAKNGDGLGDLSDGLLKEVCGKDLLQETEGAVVTSRRHFALLNGTAGELESAIDSVKSNESAEFISHHIREGLERLGEIVGEVTTDEILNEIFSSFCIGK